MEIKIINTMENAWRYVNDVEEGNTDYVGLWNKHLIEPYWPEISQWAPFDCSFMKPAPIRNIGSLKTQLDILKGIDFKAIEAEFQKITEALQKHDDEKTIVAVYPLDDDNVTVKELQNGVYGTCVFGNIIINVNPLADDFEKWIPYVFAHEFHHSVWGHNWYVLKGTARGTLLENLINEGQADAFASSLYRSLHPKWVNTLSPEQEKVLWEKFIPVLRSTDRAEQSDYLFGNPAKGLPWCVGYHFGYEIIKSYLKKFPERDFNALIDVDPEVIYGNSRFYRETR